MSRVIALIGSLDTKGIECRFVQHRLHELGHETLLIDVGVLGRPAVTPDISSSEVAAAGGCKLDDLVSQQDRGQAVAAMSRGAERLVPRLFADGQLHAIMSLGGSSGTSVACAAMRALPLGVPKVMVSTVAGGDVSGYVGVSDIVMIPSIVDVSGINRISREVFSRAAGAISGMVQTAVPAGDDKPLIAATMFGNTTTCVEAARRILEDAGYEVLVFHATGSGGRTMESLIETGKIAGVLDITTTEWADQLVGGVLSAGPTRLEAAARHGVPAIVTPACLDMVNFWAPETVPEKFRGRKFYPHNLNITLMRTTREECHKLGAIIAEKLNLSTGPVAVLLPLQGWSMIDAPDGPFWWPEADLALHKSLKDLLRPDIPVIEVDANVNSPHFSRAAAETLLDLMRPARDN